MTEFSLTNGLTFEDLYTVEGLMRLDKDFLDFLLQHETDLYHALLTFRTASEKLQGKALSAFLVHLAPWIEQFIVKIFSLDETVARLQEKLAQESALSHCRKQFIQKRVAHRYTPSECQAFDPLALRQRLGEVNDEKAFARQVLSWLEHEEIYAEHIVAAVHYAAWAIYTVEGQRKHRDSLLFRVPQKLDFMNLVPHELENDVMEGPSETRVTRSGFNLLDPCPSQAYSLCEANYCLHCHFQEKDSCSRGLVVKVKGAAKSVTENTVVRAATVGAATTAATAVTAATATDFQRNPLGITLAGCPLDQKISEMNLLYTKGRIIAALAVVTLDNPMVAGTGHRICNDCSKSCIFQKQEPVNIPAIESRVLKDVLDLPWGFEIYSLLTRWNPLNLRHPWPKSPSGYRVLIVGQGPAGFTLAHYLLNEGHEVVAIDGLKIEPLSLSKSKPLSESLSSSLAMPLLRPIRSIKEIFFSLEERPIGGFGGVTEYGITSRWDKNHLTLVRLLLERRQGFSLKGSVRFGSQVTARSAFDAGFDHIALCMGAGRPKGLPVKNSLAPGVYFASDFLMALHLQGVYKETSIAAFDLEGPILVVGGGLTAIDAATEALASYPRHMKKFSDRFYALHEEEREALIKSGNVAHYAQDIRDIRNVQGGQNVKDKSHDDVTIVYRKSLQESPAYRLNHEEVRGALNQGVKFLENATPLEVMLDEHGHAAGLKVRRGEQEEILQARTILVATGTSPYGRSADEDSSSEDFLGFTRPLAEGYFKFLPSSEDGSPSFFIFKDDAHRGISVFGDLHPQFSGSVVKAMASAKKGAPEITKQLRQRNPGARDLSPFLKDLDASVVEVRALAPRVIEVVVHAPAAARTFQPGQFFRLQNFEATARKTPEMTLLMESLALTGAWADPKQGLLSLIVLETGVSSSLCASLREGEKISLMGPTGKPTEIPRGETVLLIGGGLGNAVLFSIGEALKKNQNQVLYVAGYVSGDCLFYRERIECASDRIIWCWENDPVIEARRPQDLGFRGNVVQALVHFVQTGDIDLESVDRMFVIGSDRMMAAVQKARHGSLKPYLNPCHQAICSVNSPMQCMMKGMCGQCLQRHVDPHTGKETMVFSCMNQDQPMDGVDFSCLSGRLRHNKASEELTSLWVKKHGLL